MKKNILLLTLFSILCLSESLIAQPFRYIVTSNADDGVGTLRRAIQDANNGNAGAATATWGIPSANWEIHFDLPDGNRVITVNNALPDINRNGLRIDATVAPMPYAGTPLIVLRRGAVHQNNGFNFNWGITNCQIRGLVIQHFENGIRLPGQNNGTIIQGNYIGLTADGTARYMQGISRSGIFIEQQCSNVTIGGVNPQDRNVISGCLRQNENNGTRRGAIHIGQQCNNITIQNNYIGTNAAGTAAIGNGNNEPLNQHGIYIRESSTQANPVRIINNVISASVGNGIWAENNVQALLIQGNRIGTNAEGTAPLGNRAAGIRIDGGSNHQIGGADLAHRNIISGNGGAVDSRPCRADWCGNPVGDFDKYDGTLQVGIYFNNVTWSNIQNNYIGTDVTGTTTLNNTMGNLYAGIKFEFGSQNNTIGGATPNLGNIIGGNGFDTFVGPANQPPYRGHGIQLSGANVRFNNLYNNRIGVGSGNELVGNRQDGISLLGARDNNIGASGQGNILGNNTWGIFLQSDFANATTPGQSSNNIIRGNYIGETADGVNIGNGIRTTPVVDNDGGGIGIQHGSLSNTVGGAAAGQENIIRNNHRGIVFRHEFGTPRPTTNQIVNNQINNNVNSGVYVSGGAHTNTFTGNTITENGTHGITMLNGDNNSVFNNTIAQNGGDGVRMNEGSTGNLIGGVNANQPNTINNNAGNGVNILDATSNQNSIHRNSIFCNTARGIELNGVGNNNYAAPTFSRNGDGFIVLTGPAGSTIEVFMLTPSPCVECNEGTEGSNQLQGRTFHMSGASPLVTNITDERLITATASAANTTTAHNTSEFTPCTILCLPPVEATSASAPESICSATGGNITLTAEGGEGGAEGVFRWYANGCGTGTAVASGLVAEIAAPTTTTTYYGRWENECGDSECVSTQVQVIPNPNPFDIEFNSPISLCDTYAELTVNPVQEGVTYRWTRNGEDMGETGPTIDVYQGGTYSVIATGVDELCSTEANEAVDFSIVERPDNFTIEADGPIIFCSGNNVTLSVNPVQDGVTYHWRRNGSVYAEPGTSVSVNQAGTYRAFASFGHECITDSDNTVEITVHPNPNSFNIAADGDLIFCDGESINLSVSPAQTGISYQWTRNGANFGTPATSVNVTEAGVYNVVATGTGECTTEANATAEVIVNPNPNDFDINAAGPTTFCEGGSVNLSVSPFQGSITYQWIRDGVNIEQGTSISATQSGTYNVIASSGQACTTEADATVTVTVNENPTASITPPGDASACEGGSVELTSGGTGNRTWFRNTVLIDGETGISYNASQEGSYTVRITNPTTGCFAEATTNVTILENNFAGIAFPDGNSFCEGNDLTVNATPTNGTSYTWTLNGNPIAGDGNSISATLPGVYRVEIVLDGGCTDDAEAEVFMNENPPAFDVIADGDIVFCDGEDVTLSVNPATAGITYAWFNGADPLINGTSLVVSTSGTYTVIGTSAEECTTDANNSVEVTVNDNPDDFVVSPGGEVIFCEGGDVELQIIEIQDGITYTWTNGTDTWTGPTLTVNESGTYTATGSSSANCTTDAGNSAEVTVNPNPPAFEITADGDIIFCDGDDVTLNITPSVDGITYTWYRVDEELTAGINLLVSESGTYTAIASSGEECTTDADNSVEVTVNDNPDDFVVSPGGEVIFCEGGDVELQIIDVQDGITYTWTNGTDTWTGPTLTVNESGTYTATGSSSANCTTDAGNSADVTVNPNPPAFEITADGDIIFCDGEDVTLNITPSVDGITYTWYRVDEELTAGINLLVSESGTYTAIASSAEECTTDADNSVDVAVNDRPDAAVIVGDGTVCENTTGVDFTVQNPNAEYTYAWGISGADIASGEDSPAIVVDFGDGIGVVTITVMVTNTDTGCEADDEASANVIVNARPGALDINGPEEVCNSSTHSYTVSPVTSNSTYTWSTLTGSSVSSGAGSGTVQINFSVDAESGDISVVETNEAGCQTLVPSELAVAILQRPSGGTVAGPQSICANDQDLTYEVDGRPETSVYSWTFPSGVTVISDPANERSINVNFGSTAGNVSVLETIEYDNISCAALAPLTRAVSIRPRPQMSLSGPGNVCAGSTETYSVGPSSMTFEVWEIDTDAASNVTITPNGNNTSYQINFNGTNAPDYVTTVETIHIRVEGNGDCETNDAREMTVSIYPRPRLRDENDWTVRACSDAEVQLEVEAYHGSGGNYVYRWNTLEGLSDSTIANPVAITPVSRTYHVTAWDELDPSGYCPVTQSVYIEITSPVVLLYPPNMHICEDDSKQVRVSIVGQDGTDLTDDPDRYDVTWTAGSVGSPLSNLSSVNELEPMVTPANPGNFHYVLEINDNLSACIITRNLFVRSTHNPRVELNRSADTVCAKSPVDLTGSVNWQYPVYYPDSLTYLWYLNDTTDTELFNGARRDTNNVTINPEQHRATYYLVVQDYYGCRGYDTTVVHSIDQQELVIPNLFTPNGDNLNDTYVIRDVNGFQMFDGARMDVYNRWGKLVYRTEHYDNTWDGTDLSDGVYYYNLQPSCGEKSYKGWVQIMR